MYVLNIMGEGKVLELKQIMYRIQFIFSQSLKLIVHYKENNCHLHVCHKDDMVQDSNCFYHDNLNITKVKKLTDIFQKKNQMQKECI